MSFNPMTAGLIVQILPWLPKSPSVVELGNQTLKLKSEEVWAYIRGHLPPGVSFDRLRQVQSVAEFYHALGFCSYATIDVNSRYDSLMMDLNTNLREKYDYAETFDLVTNNGTGEHIFDQRTVLENCHNLCQVGGLMVHVMPCHYWLNHGFYNFQPKLYVDLARENHYDLLLLALGDNSGRLVEIDPHDRVTVKDPSTQQNSYTKALAVLLERKPVNVMVIAVLRKKEDRPFRAPFDGKYLDAIEDPEIKKTYE